MASPSPALPRYPPAMQSLAPTSKPGSIAATRRMRWWYEALADFMLANPHARQNDIAAHFNRSAGTISVILNTDAFKAYYRQRRAEYQGDLTGNIQTKLMNVMDMSLDVMLEKLEKKRDTLPLGELNKMQENAQRALGYGQSNAPAVVVQNNHTSAPTTVAVTISLDDLEAARSALRSAQQAPMIDVTPSSNASEASGDSSVAGAFDDLA